MTMRAITRYDDRDSDGNAIARIVDGEGKEVEQISYPFREDAMQAGYEFGLAIHGAGYNRVGSMVATENEFSMEVGKASASGQGRGRYIPRQRLSDDGPIHGGFVVMDDGE